MSLPSNREIPVSHMTSEKTARLFQFMFNTSSKVLTFFNIHKHRKAKHQHPFIAMNESSLNVLF
jgi:hypothetical protein